MQKIEIERAINQGINAQGFEEKQREDMERLRKIEEHQARIEEKKMRDALEAAELKSKMEIR